MWTFPFLMSLIVVWNCLGLNILDPLGGLWKNCKSCDLLYLSQIRFGFVFDIDWKENFVSYWKDGGCAKGVWGMTVTHALHFSLFPPQNICNFWHKKVQHFQHSLLVWITICFVNLLWIRRTQLPKTMWILTFHNFAHIKLEFEILARQGSPKTPNGSH